MNWLSGYACNVLILLLTAATTAVIYWPPSNSNLKRKPRIQIIHPPWSRLTVNRYWQWRLIPFSLDTSAYRTILKPIRCWNLYNGGINNVSDSRGKFEFQIWSYGFIPMKPIFLQRQINIVARVTTVLVRRFLAPPWFYVFQYFCRVMSRLLGCYLRCRGGDKLNDRPGWHKF